MPVLTLGTNVCLALLGVTIIIGATAHHSVARLVDALYFVFATSAAWLQFIRTARFLFQVELGARLSVLHRLRQELRKRQRRLSRSAGPASALSAGALRFDAPGADTGGGGGGAPISAADVTAGLTWMEGGDWFVAHRRLIHPHTLTAVSLIALVLSAAAAVLLVSLQPAGHSSGTYAAAALLVFLLTGLQLCIVGYLDWMAQRLAFAQAAYNHRRRTAAAAAATIADNNGSNDTDGAGAADTPAQLPAAPAADADADIASTAAAATAAATAAVATTVPARRSRRRSTRVMIVSSLAFARTHGQLAVITVPTRVSAVAVPAAAAATTPWAAAAVTDSSSGSGSGGGSSAGGSLSLTHPAPAPAPLVHAPAPAPATSLLTVTLGQPTTYADTAAPRAELRAASMGSLLCYFAAAAVYLIELTVTHRRSVDAALRRDSGAAAWAPALCVLLAGTHAVYWTTLHPIVRPLSSYPSIISLLKPRRLSIVLVSHFHAAGLYR
jgi:hypothetical protein